MAAPVEHNFGVQLEVRTGVGNDGPTPSTDEVVGEARYAGIM